MFGLCCLIPTPMRGFLVDLRIDLLPNDAYTCEPVLAVPVAHVSVPSAQFCSKCGSTLKPGAKGCSGCSESATSCATCGLVLQPGMDFCNQCGTSKVPVGLQVKVPMKTQVKST